MNEDVWKYNNGTIIVNEKYPTGDQSICQQMTWPLTYNDGVNLRPMKCNQEAYFICQNKCKLKKINQNKIKLILVDIFLGKCVALSNCV